MLVMVKGRREGKTTALIDWLFRGKSIPQYPGWNRIIVCTTHAMVRYTTKMVVDRVREESLSDTIGVADLRKAVWSVAELQSNIRGRGELFDYAVDNVDQLLMQMLQTHKSPAAITINGEPWV